MSLVKQNLIKKVKPGKNPRFIENILSFPTDNENPIEGFRSRSDMIKCESKMERTNF